MSQYGWGDSNPAGQLWHVSFPSYLNESYSVQKQAAMHLVTNARRLPAAVPLKSAVLCVDCESVSSTRFDKCPVCGSASLFSIAPMLGGSIADKQAEDAQNGASITFDVTVKIEFRHIVGEDVNAALSDITELVGVKLGRTQASLHIDVEPVPNDSCAAMPKAA